jgi:DNA-directed RNA polymerase subunit beta
VFDIATLGFRIEIQIGFTRTLQVGDKFCGRYGNKGVIAKIESFEDMAHYANGIPLDMLLNPLGVPSRLNMSQVYESAIGFEFYRPYLFARRRRMCEPDALFQMGIVIPPFDEKDFTSGPNMVKTYRKALRSTPLPSHLIFEEPWANEPFVSFAYPGSPFKQNQHDRVRLYDGRTGLATDGDCVLGNGYMLKLIHLADDKFHVRDSGPYSSLTQQPTQGKSSDGGQRLGEMEVWAFEAWGAYYNLWELFTIKSEDVQGRRQIPIALLEGFGTTEYEIFHEAPLAGQYILNTDLLHPETASVPETFRLFVRELQSLCLDLSAASNTEQTEEIDLFDFPIHDMDPFKPKFN